VYSIAKNLHKDETEEDYDDLFSEFEEAGFEITSLDEEWDED
jgi:hypothetical protein